MDDVPSERSGGENLPAEKSRFQLQRPRRRDRGHVKMVQRASKVETVLMTAFLLLSVLNIADSAPLNKSHRGTMRLCSRSLSDALYLVCRERGYNGYSYGDDEPRVDNGQGLVDECCYHPCTYEQLEQYCKPVPGEKRDESRDVM